MPVGSTATGSLLSTSTRGASNRGPRSVAPNGSGPLPRYGGQTNIGSSLAAARGQPPLQNAWNNGAGRAQVKDGGGKASLLRYDASNAKSQAQFKTAESVDLTIDNANAQAQLTAQMAQMNINRNAFATAPAFDPSNGPSPSVVSVDWRAQAANASQASTASVRQGVSNVVCKLSGLKKKHFKKGDVISIPFHTANMNPNVNPNTDKRLTFTIEGPAYSKRRMMVVMWLHSRDMFCLPLFTYSGSGLSNKQEHIKEYVTVKNVGDFDFANQGVYTPIEVECKYKPMDKNTTIHLAAGVKVGYSEDIGKVGRVNQKSYAQLLELWRDLSRDAQKEPWRN